MITKTILSIGASSCLLGNSVRYDGGHKRYHYLTDQLSQFFDITEICPEVACGLSTPREAMRLVSQPDNPSLITIKHGIDLTAKMTSWINQQLDLIEQMQLRGFILKKNSPSCGLFRVKIYQEKGPPLTSGSGLFAKALTRRFPILPVEEEGRLADAGLRENFIERVYAYDRLLCFINQNPKRGELVQFHTRHKLLLMAHSTVHYRRLGSLVAEKAPINQLLTTYAPLYMEALRLMATPSKQTNVLMHCLGYFKKQLAPWEKQELLDLIERYRTGKLPLIVPITLLKHYIRRFDQPYLAEQVYFSPHPDELMLRNHA